MTTGDHQSPAQDLAGSIGEFANKFDLDKRTSEHIDQAKDTAHGMGPHVLELVFGIVGAAFVRALARKLWHARSDKAVPRAKHAKRTWSEILWSAAIEGAIYGAIKAFAGRASVKAVRRVTGT